MKKSLLAVSLAVAGVLGAGAVHAQSNQGYQSIDTSRSYQSTNWASGFQNTWANDVYVGAQIGQSRLRHFNSASLGGGISVDNKDTSAGLNLGYQFHNHFAAEVGYTDLGTYDTGIGGIKAYTWDVALVGRLPVYGGLSATAKAGLAMTEAKFDGERSSHNTPVYGIGLEYAVNKNFAVTTNWNRYHNFGDSGHKLDNMSVGLKYKF